MPASKRKPLTRTVGVAESEAEATHPFEAWVPVRREKRPEKQPPAVTCQRAPLFHLTHGCLHDDPHRERATRQ